MKILVLCYEYPPVGGGGGRVAAQVAGALAARGHEIKVMTAGLRHLSRHEVRDGVEIFRPESLREREDTCTVPEMALYLLTGFLPAWRLAKRWKPDVIHAHFAVPTGVLALAVSRLTGIPYVLTAHLGDVPGGVPEQTASLFRLLNPLIRPVWKRAARVTAVSSHTAGLARVAYGLEPRIILNGLPRRENPLISTGETPRILFVGRLSVQKNPLLAVQALAELRDLRWIFEVIGDGPLRAAMHRECERLGLAARVVFDGWLSGEEVSRRMAASQILLMTSLHEGMPMVAVEALQHGLAIVGSDIGGLRDVVRHGENGFLCELSAAAFAEKLRSLLASPADLERMQKGSLALAPAFDQERIVDAYEQALLEAAGRDA